MGEAVPCTLEMYTTRTGRVPFEAWLHGLWDATARVRNRLDRLQFGNPGDAQSVGAGVWELRIDYGPGYRLYYARSGLQTLLLLGGGDKTSQQADIRRAQEAWEDYQQRRTA